MKRRTFLQLGGMSLALSLAEGADARRRFDPSKLRRRPGGDPLPPRVNAQTDVPTLVFIFERGGADGLNQVIPLESGEQADYRDYRGDDPGAGDIGVPISAIDAAGTRLLDAGGVDLQWGLHPRMADLMPLWEAGYLAVLPDVHYEEGSRSHFDSQQFYENGTPFQKFTRSGWMNRHLQTKDGDPLLRAVAFDTLTPFGMRGTYPNLTFSSLSDLSVSFNADRNERYLATQESVYPTLAGGGKLHDLSLSQAGESLVAAIRAIDAERPLPATAPEAEALYPNGSSPGVGQYAYFGNRLRDLAQLIKSNAFTIEMAQTDLHSWDTHRDQDTAFHNHPTLSETLARGLAGFVADLGDTFMQNVVIVVMSEFGRTARQNGSAGTDHGSAMATYVIAHPSRINGRRVIHGPDGWFGLSDLRNDRDLKHSLDYRDVLSEVVREHLGNPSPDVFPGREPTPVGVIAT